MRSVLFTLLFACLCLNSAQALTLSEAITATLKNHPTALRQRAAVQAAEATRGPLWQRFFPQVSGGLTDNFVRTSSSGIQGSSRSVNFGGSSSLPIAPSQLFAWKVADSSFDLTLAQSALIENQLALQTTSTYVNLVLAEDQIRILKKAFLGTLLTVQKDPKVIPNPQLLDAVTNLVYSFKSQLISRKSAQSVAKSTLESLTGEPAGILMTTEQLENAIPNFSSQAVAEEMARQSAPPLNVADRTIDLQRKLMQSLLPGYFQPNLGYSPNRTSNVISGLGVSQSSASSISAGLHINLDVFGYSRAHRTAKFNVEASRQDRVNAERVLLLQLTTDFIQYSQQLETACTLKPQTTQILTNLQELLVKVIAGQPYDATLLISAVPQAFSTLSQLYAAEAAVLSSMADVHAQLGDLSQPEKWIPTPALDTNLVCAPFLSGQDR